MSWDDDDFEPELPVAAAPSISNRWADEDAVLLKAQQQQQALATDEPKEPKPPKPAAAKKAWAAKEKPGAEAAAPAVEVDEATAKRERERAVLAADMQSAKDMFDGVDAEHLVDTANPKDEHDFEALADLLAAKLVVHEKSIHYRTFVRALLKKLAMPLRSENVEELRSVLTVLVNDKMRADKPGRAKKRVGTAPAAAKKGVTAAAPARGVAAEPDDEDLENDVRYDDYDGYDFM
eukprot:TRINITY_DN4592_c0_g1_i1.p1 TRINITY_DN4592_c0_g1~~TRINITY_DN4592_c0_g1_i1.p1  ORF type:complete len:263 (-),score=126.22 TRINITY_DN4592_c0_g1_i1:230-934(-)